MKNIIIFIGIILAAAACKDIDPQPAAVNGLNFMLLEEGSVKNYKQTIVNIDRQVGIYDSTEWILRETIGEQIAQSGDAKTFRVEVERRKIDETNWQAYTVYELQISREKIVRVEANNPIVILRFPQSEGSTWKGNALNTNKVEWFKYNRLNIDTTIQQVKYNSVCEVVHRDFLTLYSLESQKELYKANVGLIKKEVFNVQSQANSFPGNFDINTPLLDRLTYGTIEILEIID